MSDDFPALARNTNAPNSLDDNYDELLAERGNAKAQYHFGLQLMTC
jgi:hypothetical protein